jgi:hypothetical protein
MAGKLTHLGIRRIANELFLKEQDLRIEKEKLYMQCNHEIHKKTKVETLPNVYVLVDACVFCDKIFNEIKPEEDNNNVV